MWREKQRLEPTYFTLERRIFHTEAFKIFRRTIKTPNNREKIMPKRKSLVLVPESENVYVYFCRFL